MAGEMLGLKLIYLDAGSGAQNTISESMIAKVKEKITVPLIVGGGIRNPERAIDVFKAGADMIVIGNAIEKNPELIEIVSKALKQ
jgi:putative glycerol-1-phosphate prenyltransferase